MIELVKRSVDGHGILGTSGMVATITLADINTTLAVLVGAVTFVYMTFKALREYRAWKSGN